MKTIISLLFLLILQSSYAFCEDIIINTIKEELLENGIKILQKEYRHKEDNGIDHTEVVFMQNGKMIDTFSSRRISEIYRKDLDNDGIQELILEGYSGGAHCCFELVIIPLAPQMQKSQTMELGNSTLTLKDLDDDGKDEIILYDDLYAYFESLCYACSPGVKIALNYEKGKITLNTQLTKKLNNIIKDRLQKSNVYLDDGKSGILQFKNADAGKIISRFLYYLYTGQYTKGMDILDTYFIYESPEVKKILYSRLIQTVRGSRFWKEIKDANHFSLEQLDKMQ